VLLPSKLPTNTTRYPFLPSIFSPASSHQKNPEREREYFARKVVKMSGPIDDKTEKCYREGKERRTGLKSNIASMVHRRRRSQPLHFLYCPSPSYHPTNYHYRYRLTNNKFNVTHDGRSKNHRPAKYYIL
jgi:hypothetical protein